METTPPLPLPTISPPLPSLPFLPSPSFPPLPSLPFLPSPSSPLLPSPFLPSLSSPPLPSLPFLPSPSFPSPLLPPLSFLPPSLPPLPFLPLSPPPSPPLPSSLPSSLSLTFSSFSLSHISVEILASMIKGSLPEAMEFISSVSQLPSTSSSKMTLTHALLGLLSALLKRGSPSVDTSTCPTSSSGSTSRASSRPVSTHTSLTSLHAGTSIGGSISVVGSSATLVQQTPASDVMSEVSDDPDFHLELTSELQMASVFAMAYIWSIAGYVPFR